VDGREDELALIAHDDEKGKKDGESEEREGSLCL